MLQLSGGLGRRCSKNQLSTPRFKPKDGTPETCLLPPKLYRGVLGFRVDLDLLNPTFFVGSDYKPEYGFS